MLYLLRLLGELEVYLLRVRGHAVCAPYREDIAGPRSRRLVVVDELVAGRVVAQGRVTGGGLFKRIVWFKGEVVAANRLLSTGHRSNQGLGRTVADQGAGAIPELPLDGVGPAVLTSVDGVPVDGLQEAVEGCVDGVRTLTGPAWGLSALSTAPLQVAVNVPKPSVAARNVNSSVRLHVGEAIRGVAARSRHVTGGVVGTAANARDLTFGLVLSMSMLPTVALALLPALSETLRSTL